MPNMNCPEPGCHGDGMISSIYIHERRKTYRATARCCQKCNRHDGHKQDVADGEILAKYGVTEIMLRAEGYLSSFENLKKFEISEDLPRKIA